MFDQSAGCHVDGCCVLCVGQVTTHVVCWALLVWGMQGFESTAGSRLGVKCMYNKQFCDSTTMASCTEIEQLVLEDLFHFIGSLVASHTACSHTRLQ